MMKKNPFNPNSVVTPTLFAGRKRQVLQILKKLSQVKAGMSANFVLVGERGIGKTALAKLIMFVAQSKAAEFDELNFVTSYYSIEKGQHFRSVLQASINQVTDKLPSSILNRLTERLGSLFKGGKFSFGAFGVNLDLEGAAKQTADKQEKEQFLKDQAVSAFTNILTGMKELDGDKKDGVLIVLDEIHNLEDLEGAAQTLRSITTTLDVTNLGYLSFLIIGYNDAVDKFFIGDPSAKRSFDSIYLNIMPDSEAQELITKGFNEAGVTHSAHDLEEYIQYAGGYPHCLQIIGHHVIEVDKDNNIDSSDWTKALDSAALELQSKDFSNLYNFEGKPTLREEVLNVLALMGESVSKTKLNQAFTEKGNNIYTKSCLPELKRIGAVKENPENGALRLQSLLFRSAILLHLKTKEYQSKPWEKALATLKADPMPTS